MCVFASGFTVLIMGASMNGHAAVVAHLLDKGADVNAAANRGKQDKKKGCEACLLMIAEGTPT